FAFLRFASEEKADTNYKTLQGKELNGSRLIVDYAGAKSKNKDDPKIQGKGIRKKNVEHEGRPAKKRKF
ncbi:hypothetical protein TNCV_4258151, partial [Trichonephila clavipes]